MHHAYAMQIARAPMIVTSPLTHEKGDMSATFDRAALNGYLQRLGLIALSFSLLNLDRSTPYLARSMHHRRARPGLHLQRRTLRVRGMAASGKIQPSSVAPCFPA